MPVVDPVCNMSIENKEAVDTSFYKGTTYYFCSVPCKEKFDKDPAAFTREKASMQTGKSSGEAIHTCPMHPDIVSDKPGDCPKCGMSLEPRTVTAGEEENPELIDMSRRFGAGLVLSVPVVLIAMRHLIPGVAAIERLLPAEILKWLEFTFATPVVLWGGWPFFVRGFAAECERTDCCQYRLHEAGQTQGFFGIQA